MKLKEQRINNNNNISIISNNQTILHSRNINMNTYIKNGKNKNIYVNKILKKNLGKKHPETELSENMPNFHSNIRNILSNEENREKAIKYLIDMRKKKSTLSPSFPKRNSLKLFNNNNDINNNPINTAFSKTCHEGFYTTKNRKKKKKLDNLFYLDNKSIDYSFNNCVNTDNNKIFKKKNNKNNLKCSNNNYNVITSNMPYITTYLSPTKVDLIKPEEIIRVNKINKKNNKIPHVKKIGNIYETNMIKRSNTSTLLPNNTYKNITNPNNKLGVCGNTDNYPQNQRKYIINEFYEDNYDNRYKVKNNRYDNSNRNNYHSNNIYDSNNEEENEEYNYIDTNNNKYIEYIDDLNDNNDLDDNSSNDNSSQKKEVVVYNINEIYQNPEYEEYYSNIKIRNDNENNNHNLYTIPISKIQQMAFKKKTKKLGKYNSFYKKNNNLSSNFTNLSVEKNRFTIKMNRKNNDINNISKISSNINEGIQNYILIKDDAKTIDVNDKTINAKNGLKYNNKKFNKDLNYDNIEFNENNNIENEVDSNEEKDKFIKNDNIDKEINEKNIVNINKIRLKFKPIDKKKNRLENNMKKIPQINLNDNKYSIHEDL